MIPVIVSEKRWRAVMQAKGIDMNKVVTAAHVNTFVRAAVLAMLDQMGVTPDKKGK